MNVRRVFFCVAVFYGIMVFLNGAAMQRSAARTEYGWWRDALCAANAPFDFLSRRSGLCHLRDFVRDTAGSWLNGNG